MSKRHFTPPEDYSDYSHEEDMSEDQTQEEPSLDSDFEVSSEGTSLFTRETKLGLAVILVLVLVLGVVLVKRLFWTDSSSSEAKQATADTKKSVSSQGPTQTPSSAPKPTVVEPRPSSPRHGSPSEVAPWVPSSGVPYSKEGGARVLRGLLPSEEGASPSHLPSSSSLTPVRPAEPVGTAWTPGQAGGQAGPGDLPSSPRPPSGFSPPAGLGSGNSNPLRSSSPSEPGRPSSFPGESGLSPPPNSSGTVPPAGSHYGGHSHPAREGQPYQTTPSQPGTNPGGSFTSPYTPPASSSVPQPSGSLQGPTAAGSVSSHPGEFSSGGGNPGGLRPLNTSGPQPSSTTAPLATAPQPTPAASPGASWPSGGTAPASAHPAPQTYVVQPGDSYWTIAEKLYGSGGYYQALAEYNRSRLPQPEQLRVGDQLLIPSLEQLQRAYPHLCPQTPGRGNSSLAVSSAGTTQESGTNSSSGRVYIVQEGDSLYEIARYLLGKPARWVEIYELNKEVLGEDIEHLRPGTRLLIPPASASSPSGPMSAEPSRPLPR